MYYLDTSAAVKLVVEEKESAFLRAWLTPRESRIFSSDLLRTELLRATRRLAPDSMGQARLLIDSLLLIGLTSAIFENAARLDPFILRSLDALHLAAAIEMGDNLQGIVCYDRRMAESATQLGITVIGP